MFDPLEIRPTCPRCGINVTGKKLSESFDEVEKIAYMRIEFACCGLVSIEEEESSDNTDSRIEVLKRFNKNFTETTQT